MGLLLLIVMCMIAALVLGIYMTIFYTAWHIALKITFIAILGILLVAVAAFFVWLVMLIGLLLMI